MNGTQLAVLLLAIAVILTNINLVFVKKQNKLLMELIDRNQDELGDLLKDNKFFAAQLKKFASELSDLLDLIKRGDETKEN